MSTNVQIVTDSGSDLTPALAQQFGITVVPLQVLIEGQTYRDGVDLTPESFYAKMRASSGLPKTSQPTPADYVKAYSEALTRGSVVGLHLSSALSGTYPGAVMVAKELSDQIGLVDTLTGSGGLSLLAMEAAQMARDGADQAAILSYLEHRKSEIRVFVALNTLDNAIKGGRVSPVAGFAAKVLGIKPIVHVSREGKVVPIDKVRGRQRTLERLIELAQAERSSFSDRTIMICHGNVPDEAASFASLVRERLKPKEILMAPIGATIGTYAAEGAMLLSF